MQKYYILFVLTTIIHTCILTTQAADRRGSGDEKYHYFMTEGWLESDHSGSGFHLVDDYTKPNIWMRVFRYDTAVSQVVGLPNNETAGSSADWGDSLDSSNPPMRGGDYYKLLRTVDFSEELAEIQSDGNCSSIGRCYGDWINNDLLWSVTIKDYTNKNGESFLKLKDQMQGQKRTRYRFDVYIEDNTAFWFKDKEGKYDLNKIPANGGYHTSVLETDNEIVEDNVLYYPLEKVVFRIVETSKLGSLPNENDSKATWDNYYEEQNWAEYHLYKKDSDLVLSNTEPQSQRVNGRLVYNFRVIHSFRLKAEYTIQILAEDHSGNRRAMQIPIQIERLKGLEIRDNTSGSQRF
ncbi:MAG: hypothetical protein VX619_00245 [bacterium]|nr:hypothetical protein [bacterium]